MNHRPFGSALGLRRAGRRTNLALLGTLVAAAVTGGFIFAAGTDGPARLAAIAHGLFGLAVVLLAPWKTVIIRRAPSIRAASLILLTLVVICVGSGLVEVFGGYGVLWHLSPMQVHVGSALLLAPLLVWHVLRHRRQRLRRLDLSRWGGVRRPRGCRRARRICIGEQNRDRVPQGRRECHSGDELAVRHGPLDQSRASRCCCRIFILDTRPRLAIHDHRRTAGLHQRLVRRRRVDRCEPW